MNTEARRLTNWIEEPRTDRLRKSRRARVDNRERGATLNVKIDDVKTVLKLAPNPDQRARAMCGREECTEPECVVFWP